MSREHQDMRSFVEDIYERLVDDIVSMPLIPPEPSPSIERTLRINQRIVNNIHSLRRYLELNEEPFANLSHSPLFDFENDWLTQTIPQLSRLRGNPYNRTFQSVQRSSPTFFSAATLDNQVNSALQDLFSTLITDTFEQPDLEDVKVTLSEEEFNKLPTLDVTDENKESFGEKECNICIEGYEVGTCVTKLPCGHVFHKDCIQNWLCSEKVNCPVCRKDTRE